MERITSGGNFVTRNLFLITVFCFYALAAAGPVWGLGWDSPFLAPWTALCLALLVSGSWRYLKPGRSFPKTDLAFIIPVIVSVDLFSVLLGDSGEWVRPMNYLLVALCALFYSVWFNFAVSGLIFFVAWAGVFLAPGSADTQTSVSLGVYGAYLGCIPLVLGRLFHFEYKKKERAIREYRKLSEGAEALNPAQAGADSIKYISEEYRKAGDIDATALLERGLAAVLETVRSAMSARNAVLFMPDAGGDALVPRLTAGDGPFRDCGPIAAGQGLIGWVVKERKPLLALDRPTLPDYLEDTAAGSFAAVPVLDDARLEGVIAVDSGEREAFTDADRHTLELFGGIVLQMLRDARASRAVGMTVENFRSLNTVSRGISSSLDLPTIMQKLTVLIRDVVPYDFMTISLLEGEGEASFRVMEGYGGLAAPFGPVQLENSYLDWIVKNRTKLSFNDFNRRTDKMPIFPARELQTDFRSFLGQPLISQDRVLGVLTVALRRPGGLDAYQQDMLGIIADQVAVYIANAKLHHTIKLMATTDGLTGLINHRHFQEKTDERFARAARYPEEISLLLFDIDHFKKVNDTYGHPVGDAVLRKVAAIVREAARNVDVAARYGGEEFAVLMENTDEPGAMKMAERIRKSIEKTKFVFEGNTVPVTVSIGCASFPKNASDKKGLIDKADKSLYWAKRNGRNRCCAYSSIAGETAAAAEND